MRGAFADSALAAIEFPDALAQVSRYAVTPLGAERILGLRPSHDTDIISSELARVSAVAERLEAGDDVEPVPFGDPRAALSRLRLDGSVLEGEDLVAVGRLLAAGRAVAPKIRRAASNCPVLAVLAAPLPPPSLDRSLTVAVDPDGRVRDEASRTLARLRRELVSARQELVRTLERLLASVDIRHRPGDGSVTVRGGRYVIPVRREARGQLGGIVHDQSATHATLFVEPAETIELGNRLRELESDEAREVLRVLRELTNELRPHADLLDGALEMLVVLDSLYARARFAAKTGGTAPRVVAAGETRLDLRRAAHPLLFSAGAEVVRFDLALEGAERTVLVSGPNTGGKTVLLKAVGVAVALAQSGVVPPVGEGSVIPVFDALFADIGDRQSIAESLSTFSAHVAALRDVLENAGAGSLVLLDEVGTGTDPAEGAALAAAVLRALTARGATTLASTHLGALKELAGSEQGVVNASLQFDAATLAPTFVFAKGVPGRSYGLAIARRLGVGEEVLEDAEGRLSDDERRLDAALASVERRAQDLERLAEDLAARATGIESQEARLGGEQRDLARREDEVRATSRELERSRKQAMREVLLEARGEVERAIGMAREGREKEARRALEEAIAGLAESDARDAETDLSMPASEMAAADIRPGRAARIRSLGLVGEIESVQGQEVTLLVRGRRVRVRVTDLADAGSAPGVRA